jgi:hypothetical protein
MRLFFKLAKRLAENLHGKLHFSQLQVFFTLKNVIMLGRLELFP